MVDQTRRKLQMPNWYAPYLEKHRIYELFHELTRELLIQEPVDHILFLREILYNASNSRFAPRVVLIAPPQINTYAIAAAIAKKAQVTVIKEEDIITAEQNLEGRPKPKIMTRLLQDTLRTSNVYHTGWILPDYPKHISEAKFMLQVGILPTHVFQFIPSYSPNLYEINKDKHSASWSKYRHFVIGARNLFKYQLKEIVMIGKETGECVETCLELLAIRKRNKAPIIPRLCILGPRGSGREIQANKLSEVFNIVHVNFEYLLCQAWISETHLGSLLRAQRDSIGQNSLLLTAVVHKRILEQDCINRGWVITGFPNTAEDLKNLNMLDTPPNRIIFLECDLIRCKSRLLHRRINIHSGSYTNIPALSTVTLGPQYKTHPKDVEELVTSELKYYCENYEALRTSCGKLAFTIDANQSVQWVTESIEAILMRPLPAIGQRVVPVQDTNSIAQLSEFSDDSNLECYCSPCTSPRTKNSSEADVNSRHVPTPHFD